MGLGFGVGLLDLYTVYVVWVVVSGLQVVGRVLVLVVLFWGGFAVGCSFGFSAWLICVGLWWLGWGRVVNSVG